MNNKNKKLKAKTQKKNLEIGLYFRERIAEVLCYALKLNKIYIAENMAITPPNLSGIDLSIA